MVEVIIITMKLIKSKKYSLEIIGVTIPITIIETDKLLIASAAAFLWFKFNLNLIFNFFISKKFYFKKINQNN